MIHGTVHGAAPKGRKPFLFFLPPRARSRRAGGAERAAMEHIPAARGARACRFPCAFACFCLSAFGLAGCADGPAEPARLSRPSSEFSRAADPSRRWIFSARNFPPRFAARALSAHPAPPARGQDAAAAVPADCSLGDRFDRTNALAYDFGGGQSRMGLSLRGVGLKTLTDFEMESVTLQFRYRLQPIPGRKEKCRYRSGWQGLGGSAYNELFRRENDTVWRALGDRGLDFWN